MITLTPEEEAILRPEYDKYLERSHKWKWNQGSIMSFDEWWRAMADEIKSRRPGK